MTEATSGGRQWQCHLATPGERLAYLRHSGHLSDLTITFPGHHNIIQAHRWVLAMSSPVFEAMLYGPLAEGEVLALPEDPPQAFEWLLDHMYRNQSQLPGVQLALQVYQLAAKYQMDPLCQLCSQYLIQEVTPEFFPGVYEAAVLLGDEQLLSRCAQMLWVSSDSVLSSRNIGVLGRASLRQLLHHHQLAASSEAFVFRAIVAWGREHAKTHGEGGGGCRGQHPHLVHVRPHLSRAPPTPAADQVSATTLSRKVKQFLPQVKVNGERESPERLAQTAGGSSRASVKDTLQPSSLLEPLPVRQQQWMTGEEPTGRNLRKMVDEFLPCVRFLSMTTDEFVEHVLPSGVLSSDESVAILMNIKDIPNVPMPRFATSVNKSKKNRLKSASLLICEHHYTSNDQEILRDFKVPTTIYLTQLTAPGVTSVKETAVKILSAAKTVNEGRWQGIGCKFDYPVKLEAGACYSVVVEGAYGPCAGCECSVASNLDGMEFTGKTLGLTPVFLEYMEAP
nr:uncharacterized protein LOC123759563 [Procambarus clarkii]